MTKLCTAMLGIAFAASTLLAPAGALADDHGHKGKKSEAHECRNAAHNTRGWCKHGDNDEDNDAKHRGGSRHGNGTISGTVISANGTTAVLRLDNNRGTVTVRENGTVLNVGSHYDLNGCYQGDVFVLGCYTNGNYPGGQNQQIAGTILSVSGNTITLLGLPPVTIDAHLAIQNNRTNGSLSIGRHITAYGYYQNGTFFATSIS